mmetsp:Transcript_7495/g.23962  ORF Transcript_7495/g.23962 Transcript_7495/m.23962 type:complete len:432 (+) Transcript_7495:193-1488(+)
MLQARDSQSSERSSSGQQADLDRRGKANAVLHDVAHELGLAVAVRRVAQPGVHPGGAGHDGLGVRKLPKAPDAVVRAHPRIAHATERQVGVAAVEDAVIDANAAAGHVVDETINDRLLGREHVERERLLTCENDLARLLLAPDRNDRQHGAKDLLLHDSRVEARVQNQGERNEAVLAHRFLQAASEDLPAVIGRVHEASDAVPVALVDDATVARALAEILPKKRFDRRLELVQEWVENGLVDEQVVGRDAGLPIVESLRVDEPLRNSLDARGLVDVSRALAAKLERDRRQVCCRSALHNPADRAIARVHDVVPAQAEESSRLGNGTLHHLECVAVQVVDDDLLGDFGTVDAHLGRLEHCSVARGDEVDERSENERNGVVPRAKNKHHALGLAHDVARGRLRGDGRLHLLRLHPGGKVGFDEFDLLHRGHKL